MREAFFLLSFILGTVGTSAQTYPYDKRDRFFKVIPESEQQLHQDTIAKVMQYLPKMKSGTTLKITEDEMDSKGVHHYYAVQMMEAAQIENYAVRLHIKDGKLLAISGQVAEDTETPSAAKVVNSQTILSAKEALAKADLQVSADKAKKVAIMDNGTFVTAYVVTINTNKVYVDASTGAIIRQESLIRKYADGSGTDTKGKAGTYYYGERDITSVLMSDGKYVLHDNGRHIYTYDASWYHMNTDSLKSLAANNEDFYAGLYKVCGDFTSTTSDWLNHTFGVQFNGYTFNSHFVNSHNQGLCRIVPLVNNTLTIAPEKLSYTLTSDTTATIRFDESKTLERNTKYLIGITLLKDGIDRANYATILTASADKSVINSSPYGTLWTDNRITDFQPALDIHWGMEKVIDFYHDKFQRDSYNNKGSNLRLYFNISDQIFSGMTQNAFAVPGYPEGLMGFGCGYPTLKPVVMLEVMGHEFTHLVATHLAPPMEAGALNEAFGDIMGNAIHYYATGDADYWQVGKGIYMDDPTKVMRDIKNPENCECPTQYKGKFWRDADEAILANDYGWVHFNSCVVSHWYYLLCCGNDTITPIDRDRATQIALYTLLGYQFPYMGFQDARKASVFEAALLFGANSQEVATVRKAWNAVKVLDSEGEDPIPTAINTLSGTDSKKHTDNSAFTLGGNFIGTDAANLPKGIYIQGRKKIIKK